MITANIRTALILVLASITLAEDTKPLIIDERHYRVYRGDGAPATLDQLAAESRASEVTFLGETHDDPVAHYLEEQILRRAFEPNLAFALEMFETDVQYVMDEYLAGLITEEHLMASGRAWRNYKSDYRPLIEFAKEKKMPVVASNAPRRYVNRVSRLGVGSLEGLEPEARRFLPPLPYAKASAEYAAKFAEVMKQNRESGKEASPESIARRLEAQSLWDAGMAYSIANFLTHHPGMRILHVNGRFHTDQRLGIVEHFMRYRPGAKVLVVTIASEKSFPRFDAEKMSGQGDFVVVTDAAVPRSSTSPY